MSDLESTPALEALLETIRDNTVVTVVLTDAFFEAWAEMKELGAQIRAGNAAIDTTGQPHGESVGTAKHLLESGLVGIWQDRPEADLAALEQTPLENFKPNGLCCSVCREPQYCTSGGEVCKNGHGGAPGVDRREAVADAPEKHDTAVKSNKRTPKPLPEDWEPDDTAKCQLAEQGFDEAGRKALLQEYRQAMAGEVSGRWTSKRFLRWWDEEKVKRAAQNTRAWSTSFSAGGLK